MVRAKIRVEGIYNLDADSQVFGKTKNIVIHEEVYESEYDRREILAPFGIAVSIKMKSAVAGEFDTIKFELNRYIFDEDAIPKRTFHKMFTFDEKVYEVSMGIVNGKIADFNIWVWDDLDSYTDQDDADETYTKNDCETFEILRD